MLRNEPDSSRQCREIICWRICAIVLFLFAATACGRKGPPVLPQLAPQPQVIGLKGIIENDMAELSWRMDPKDVIGSKDIASFYLYQATVPLDDKECEGCPQLFEHIAAIPLTPFAELPDGGSQWRYRLSLNPGFKYSFKVNILFSNGSLGPDSEIVELEH